MAKVIDLNCDMGESYGRWTLGADEAVMPHISSANVACGFHGGDPHVIRKTVALALRHRVAVGAHPSLPDLMGFGRRVMDVTPAELKDYVCYQVGAVREFCRAAGVELQHVKPHGILYTMAEGQEALAQAIGEASRESGERLILMTLASGKFDAHCRKMGARVASEGFADRAYEVDGHARLAEEGRGAHHGSRAGGRPGGPDGVRGEGPDDRRRGHRHQRPDDLLPRRHAGGRAHRPGGPGGAGPGRHPGEAAARLAPLSARERIRCSGSPLPPVGGGGGQRPKAVEESGGREVPN